MTAPAQSRIDQLLAANRTFAETWKAPPTMKQIRSIDEEAVLVLTCMDPRVVPEQFVGPNPRLAVYRNAGGRFDPDAVRTINVVRALRYKSEKITVMVVHHTDCGMTHLTNDGIKEYVASKTTGGRDVLNQTNFGCFAAEDLEKSIRDDVQALRAQEVLEGIEIRGFVLVTETGLLRELEI